MSASFRRPPRLFPIPARRDAAKTDSSLRELLTRLMRGEDLSRAQAAQLLEEILQERTGDAEIGAVLVALSIKGETVEELTGMAEALRARSMRLKCAHEFFIDTAGTGSSHAKTFNVSTAAALVCAGAGVAVAKHGSRAATSRSGSADVLAALGVNVEMPPALSERCLDEVGLCFLFAPLYHRATARVAGLRRQLGLHTTFNLLGPLTNPAGAPCQIIGVWHESLLEPIAYALLQLGTRRAWVVHGSDGLDEITTSGPSEIAQVANGSVGRFTITPEDFGLARQENLQQLRGGDASANAELIKTVLRNESGTRIEAARDLVIANAAAAIFVAGAAQDFSSAAAVAANSLKSGAALKKLEALRRASR